MAFREKGTGPFCRNGPEGASHKRVLSPFANIFHAVGSLSDRRKVLLQHACDDLGAADVGVRDITHEPCHVVLLRPQVLVPQLAQVKELDPLLTASFSTASRNAFRIAAASSIVIFWSLA